VRIDKWDCSKLKSFGIAKETTERRHNIQGGRKSLPPIYPTVDYIFRIYKELKKLNTNKRNNPISRQMN
jgi:hypothetical protein